MMAAYPQHPNQLQHQVQQQGPQQHLQGHPGQAQAMAMQQMHPHQQQNVAYQQAQMAALAGGGHPANTIQQQALLVRQRQQQQLMGTGNPMVFQGQNHGGPQVRPGMMPNGMYAGGVPGSVPGGNMGAFAAGNPQMMRYGPQLQQHLQQQHQQQQQIAAAQQFTMASQAAGQGNTHASAMAMPQQNPGHMPMQMQQAQHMQMQRAAAAQAAAHQQQQQQQKTLGISVLRLHQFVDHLSSFNPTQDENNIEHWRKFIGDFFSPVGVMRQQLRNNEKNEYKQFEIPTNLLARYYFTLFESGIQTVQLTLEHPREKAMVNQGMMVECAKASFVYWFDNGCHLVAQGALRVTFNRDQTIDMLDFQTQNHTEYIKRSSVNELLAAGSPEIIKASPGKPFNRPQQMSRPPPSKHLTNSFGIPSSVQQLLENAETFSQMKDLINFSHANQHLGPNQALVALVHQQQQHLSQQRPPPGVNPNQQPGQQPGGPQPNPQQQQQQQQSNPQNQQNSQHNSPMITGMQQPGVVSNPGSQSSTTVGSANTSPNQTNKRRRNSASSNSNSNNNNNGSNGFSIKTEEDEQAKVKQSPRVGGGKRAKLGS